jgi:hypothetical protein
MTKNDAWWWALLAVLVAGIFAHSYLPRYELHEVRDPASLSIVVYDKWTGRVQRAVYDDKGGMNVMGVYTPF